MTFPFRRRPSPRPLALAALVASLALGGCSPRSNDVVIQDDSGVRLGEARRLALEAQRAQAAGDKDRAIALYRQSLAQSRDLYTVWNNLGLLLMERQDYLEAADMFISAAELAPKDPKPYYNAGLLYDLAGHAEPALDFYQRSLERDDKYLNSLRGAAKSARLLQRADEPALARVRTALMIEKDPKWREFFEREQVRLEGQLAAERALKTDVGRTQEPRLGEIRPGSAGETETPRPTEPPAPGAVQPRP